VVHSFKEGGGKGGNMSELVIQVKLVDGDLICKPDPGRKKISDSQGNKNLEIKWHWNEGEFSVIFEKDLDSPFEDGTYEKASEGGWITANVKEHTETTGYVYEVKTSGTSGKKPLELDPGLIIDP
jgi:hypothetical protein